MCPCTIESFKETLANSLSNTEQPVKGEIGASYILVKIKEEERHFWSPQLSISLEENEKGTIVRGLYGPKPSIWTLFAFSYGAIAVLITFIGIIGLSNMMLKKGIAILWTIPVLLLIALVLYIIAQFGQKVGNQQTFILHHFMEDSIHERIEID
jgi:hypothetical protein